MLRSLYQAIKNIPVVGPLATRLKLALYPHIEARRLRARDLSAAHGLVSELLSGDPSIHRALNLFRKGKIFSAHYGHGYSGDYDAMVLYATVRKLQPEVVVETGVASGRSSAAILLALEENKKGKLISIDLAEFYEGEEPEYYQNQHGVSELKAYIPKDKKVGWMVPESLRGRWQLVIGDSNVELPKIFAEHPIIDVFYHDSDHSYETMKHEFALAWPQVRPGGVLFADDIRWNKSWEEFVAANPKGKPYVYRSFGALKK